MPATENGVYVKTDLYPSATLDDDIRNERRHHHHDHDDDHPPVVKLARYAISPSPPILSSNHGYAFDSHLTSPIPRRKQARPRRRSGDSSTTTSPSLMTEPLYKPFASTPSPVQDMPEDLSIKKSPSGMSRQESEDHSARSNDQDSRSDTPLPVPSLKAESVNSDSGKSEFSLIERNNLFSPGPSGSTSQLSGLPLTMSMSTISPTTNSLLSMTPIHQSDRRKGQHSAPRGGPPRAWTNGDLTEALNHVWNRKMTTSQASRVFGIPYNSLLMYVRGKYGKSLKLDTLRKETLEGEAMALAASTRGSYKLAAAAAAAAAAASSAPTTNGKNNSKNNGTGDNSASTGTTTPNASPKNAVIINNNTDNHNNNSLSSKNNNGNVNKNNTINNNSSETKATKNLAPVLPSHLNLPGAYPPHHLNEMEALSMAGLAAAGLGGFGGVNPYLSYFCDFSFPLPMGLASLMQPSAALTTNKHRVVADPLHKKASTGKMSKHRGKGTTKAVADHLSDTDNKEDNDAEDGSSPLPLRLSRPMIPPARDRSQTGQV